MILVKWDSTVISMGLRNKIDPAQNLIIAS